LPPLVQGGARVADSLLRADFENFRTSHPHTDTVSAMQTPGVDFDFLTGEKMAHGQRFEASLAIPFLYAVYTDEMMIRKTGERCPRPNVISVRCHPCKKKRAFSRGLPDDLPRFFWNDGKCLGKLGVVRCSSCIYEMT
jgi:hypothetical protein